MKRAKLAGAKKQPVARQYARVQTKLLLCAPQRLNVEHPNKGLNYDHSRFVNRSKYYESPDNFHQWLVGFTDGDGSFTISRLAPGKWTLFFKLSQSTYNLRILYFIKKQLGVGSVYLETGGNKGDFRIRDRKVIGSIILPIFDKYPLLTAYQSWSYERFKKAYYILENQTLNGEGGYFLPAKYSPAQLDTILNLLLNSKFPEDPSLVSPVVYSHLNPTKSKYDEILSFISIPWLIGFVESKAIFSIGSAASSGGLQDNKFSLVFTLELNHHHPDDKLLLQLIKRILHIKSSVRYSKYNSYVLETRNSRAISNIINLFTNKFRGMKSLNFKLWSRAYLRLNNQTKIRKISIILTKVNNKFIINSGRATSLNNYRRAVRFNTSSNIQGMILTKRMYSTTGQNNKINPVVVYSISNSLDRERIIQENKNKSGIYRWTNNLNGKSYVGSSINLSKRFNQYFSPKLLSNRRYISLINQALLKYKVDNFSLEILEYCAKESVLDREQLYLNLLKPKYNIYLKAGSPMGFKHSEKSRAIMKTLAERRRHSKETRLKIGASLKGRVLLAETLAKMVNNRTNYKHSDATKEKLRAKLLGRKFSQETKDKMAISQIGHRHSEETIAKLKKSSYTKEAVEIFDTETGLKTTYESKSEAAKAMGVSMPTISNHIKGTHKKLLKKRYQIVRQDTLAGADLEKSLNFRKTPLEVLDIETGIKTTYGSKAEAGEALGVTTATLRKYIKSQELLKNRFKLN